MIRVIVHIAKAAIAAITALLLFSCGMETSFKTVDGDGNVVTRTRNIDTEFTGIDTGGVFEVIIEQGSPQSVRVEADSNLQEHITTKVNGSVLEISSNVNISEGTRRVFIIMPVLKGVSASGASSVRGKGTFKSESLSLNTSGAARIEISADSDTGTFDTSGSSKITVTGKAEKLTCDSSGSSVINAKNMAAKKVTADASGSSMIHVNPLESLAADGSGSSRITFKNTPGELSKDTSGSASVSQEK